MASPCLQIESRLSRAWRFSRQGMAASDHSGPHVKSSDYRGPVSQARDAPVQNTARYSHLLIHQEYREHKRALILASAFQETAKLAKRIQELEVMDAQLEGYRQMLRAAIAFQRRRRVPRNRLDSIPEICAEPDEAADEDGPDED